MERPRKPRPIAREGSETETARTKTAAATNTGDTEAPGKDTGDTNGAPLFIF